MAVRKRKEPFPDVSAFLKFLREKNPGKSIRQREVPGYKMSPFMQHPFPVHTRQREVLMDGQNIGILEYSQGTSEGIYVSLLERYPQMSRALADYRTIRYEGLLPTEGTGLTISLGFNFWDKSRNDGNAVPFP